MSATAYWFCPENDIALAGGKANFTPPRQAALLARYGAPLMWWLGASDDVVLVPSDLTAEEADALYEWESSVTACFGAGPRLLRSLGGVDVGSLRPWGWSAYAAARLRKAGAPLRLLAEVTPQLEAIRLLSHRRSSVEITRRLAETVDFDRFGIPAGVIPQEVCDISEIMPLLEAGNGLVAKSPWSSSGRGVVSSRDMRPEAFLRRCANTIRRQGSVMIENHHDVVADFAMLFESTAAGVNFIGLSRFHNCRGASYAGNDIATDGEIRRELSALIPGQLLEEVQQALRTGLTDMTGGCYRGPLGVDMLVAVRADGSRYLVPCVELNLRCTMGFVAHALRRRLPSDFTRMTITAAGHSGVPAALRRLALVPTNPCFSIVAE